MNLANKIRRLLFPCCRHVIYPCRLKFITVQSNDPFERPTLMSSGRYEEHKTKLLNLGFSHSQVHHMLELEPGILKLTPEVISSSFIKWYCFKISELDLLKSIASCPKLLFLEESMLKSRIKELMRVFTQKDIVKLLKTYPEIFLNDFENTVEKVQYIIHCMGIEQASIVKSGALHSNIEQIQLRHRFLFYAGKYKKPKQKIGSKNAPLDKILHKNLNTYLKLSGLTVEEYDVFSEVFDRLSQDIDEVDYDDDVV